MIGRDRVRFTHALVLAAGLAAAGCSTSGDDLPREPVTGTVTLDGQPLANGVISFNPVGERMAGGDQVSGGAQITGGKFTIPRETGLVPGNYNVTINAASQSERTKPAQAGGGKPSELPKELIPAKYNSSTELKADVKKGVPNDFTFTLVTK